MRVIRAVIIICKWRLNSSCLPYLDKIAANAVDFGDFSRIPNRHHVWAQTHQLSILLVKGYVNLVCFPGRNPVETRDVRKRRQERPRYMPKSRVRAPKMNKEQEQSRQEYQQEISSNEFKEIKTAAE